MNLFSNTGGLPPSPPRSPPKRKRDRDDAGKGPQSWKKHRLFGLAFAQFHAFRRKFPNARCVIIDFNAGDGEGVDLAQGDLFGPNRSRATAELAAQQAATDNVFVILCEKQADRFAKLKEKYGTTPRVTIIRDHRDVVPLVVGFDYAIVLSDPCGPAGHGEDILGAVSRAVPKADFIIALNLHGVNRINGTHQSAEQVGRAGKANATSRERHGWKNDPYRWQALLGRRHMASSRVIPMSSTFTLQMLVIADFVVVKDSEFEVLA